MKAETRHRMKRDEFVGVFTKAASYAAENPRQILMVLGIVGALVAITIAGYLFKGHQDARANEALQQGLAKFKGAPLLASTQTQESPDYGEAAAHFQQAGGYTLSGLADPARLMTAVSSLRMGKTADATAALQSLASARTGFNALMARLVLAESLLQEGKFAEAAGRYKEIAQTNDPGFPTDYAMYAAGLSLYKAGDLEAAVATFKKLKTQYPTSSYVQNADEEIRRIAPDQAEE